MEEIYLGIIVPVSILLPVSMAAMRYRRLTAILKTILLYLVIAGVVNAVAVILAMYWVNNMPLLHFYTVIEFMVLAVFYHRVLHGPVRTFIRFMYIIFPLVCMANALFIQSIYLFNTITRSVEAFIIGSLSVVFLFQQLGAAETVKRQPEAVHWINAGLLLYFAGSFFLFLFSTLIMGHRQVDDIAWVVHASLVLMMYILFTIGFLKAKA